MDLTKENKQTIDAKTHYQLLRTWRFGTGIKGTEWLQGETGTYWGKRMAELKSKDPDAAVQDSKNLGWGSGF